MPRHLVIVESPAKARTLGRYLGRDFTVRASLGHVRDLPRDELGVDLARGFTPAYEVLPARRRVLAQQHHPDASKHHLAKERMQSNNRDFDILIAWVRKRDAKQP